MAQMWFSLLADLKWSDVLATIALFLSLFTFLTTGRQNRRTRALVVEEKRTALLRTINIIRNRMKEAISRIRESKSLLMTGEQETMIENMNSNLSKMTSLRDQLQSDRHVTETELEARVADYEETAQMAEGIIATLEKHWDHPTLGAVPQHVDPTDRGGKASAT